MLLSNNIRCTNKDTNLKVINIDMYFTTSLFTKTCIHNDLDRILQKKKENNNNPYIRHQMNIMYYILQFKTRIKKHYKYIIYMHK